VLDPFSNHNLLHVDFIDIINHLDDKLQSNLSDIKKEYQYNITEEKIKLLMAVCNGEGLDFDKIKGKYLKNKELSQINFNIPNEETSIIEEDLLDKLIIGDKEYYYEHKEKGIVYDIDSKPVGIYTEGKVIFV
jgi:hypothetical protein